MDQLDSDALSTREIELRRIAVVHSCCVPDLTSIVLREKGASKYRFKSKVGTTGKGRAREYIT